MGIQSTPPAIVVGRPAVMEERCCISLGNTQLGMELQSILGAAGVGAAGEAIFRSWGYCYGKPVRLHCC